MDVEQLRETYRKTAWKLDYPTETHLFSVMLGWDQLCNRVNVLSSRHRHVTYEVRCSWSADRPDQGVFEIIPPGVWHTGYWERSLKGTNMVAFQFSVHPRAEDRRCGSRYPNEPMQSFLLLQDSVELPDSFGGIRQLLQLREELERREKAQFEQIYVRQQLLLIALARALPVSAPEEQKHGNFLLSDFYPEVIETFLARHYMDPTCSRQQLAELLCVSERQLIRIMERMYGQTFRELLTEFRMESAERWRLRRGLSAAENAAEVGYLTTKGFLKAYAQYHGREYREQTGQKSINLSRQSG